MKRSISIIFFIALTLVCFGQRKIKKVEVREIGFHAKLSYKPINDLLTFDGLQIRITPVSADALNEEFTLESHLDGVFEYTAYRNSRESYFLKRHKKRNIKSDSELLYEGVRWLFDNETINQEEYDNLLNQISDYYAEDQPEKKSNEFENSFRANPYRLKNKYLSVFKVEIINPNDVYKTLNEEFIIQQGDKSAKPLDNNDIIQLLKLDGIEITPKIENLERHNLTLPLTIVPKSKCIKYMAIPPLKFEKEPMMISLPGNTTKFQWEVIGNVENIDEMYTYYEFNIAHSFDDFESNEALNFTVLNVPVSIAYIDDNILLVDEKHLSDNIDMFTYSLKDNRLYFNRKTFKLSEYIDFQKNKRSTIKIETEKIPDLSR